MGDKIAVPVLYLDLDGTVREGKEDGLGKFVNGPEDVKVFPQALAQMRAWKKAGGRILGVSNQGGIALGIVSKEDVEAAVYETQRQCFFLFNRIMICPHHPDADTPEQARCWCRKPRPGLAIQGILELMTIYPDEYYPPHLALFVGDRIEDYHCAEALNVDYKESHIWHREAPSEYIL